MPSIAATATFFALSADAPITRKVGRLFWVFLSRIVVVAAFGDLLLMVFFLIAHSRAEAWLNLAGVTLYAIIYLLLKHRRNQAAIFLIWMEVFGHAAVSTIMTGWNSGYHYYLLLFVPTIIISTPRRRALCMLTILWSFYLGLLFTMRTISPLEPINHRALLLLEAFNASMLFGMVTYFTFMYRRLASASEQKLRLLATTDPLTGLFNRRHASEMAAHEAGRNERSGRPLSFILADLDHFKAINDRYGHQGGDTVLIAVSQALGSLTRAQDILARWGGEEFLLVLPETSREGAAELASRMHRMMQTLRPMIGGEEVRVSLTMGVSSQRRNESYEAVLARADRALYQGKRSGRNCVRLDLDEPPAPESEPQLYHQCTQAA